MPAAPTRLVLAEDSVLLREALVSLLRDHGFEVAAAVGDAEQLLAAVERHAPAVVLTDIRMPPTRSDEGVRAAESLGRSHPDVGVVLLSQYLEPRTALRMLQGGVRGRAYLLKDHIARVEVLVEAVRTVAAGGTYVDPAVIAPLIGQPHESAPLSGLSPRELEILSRMAAGRSNKAICDELFVSPKTVEAHVRNLFLKLNLPQAPDDHRRVLAVLRYLDASNGSPPPDGG